MRAGGGEKKDFLLFSVVDLFPVAEEILLQEPEGRRVRKSGLFPRPHPYGILCAAGELRERADHPVAHIKELMRLLSGKKRLPHIHCHRDSHFPAHGKKFPDNLILDRRKSGKSVQQENTSPDLFRKRDLFLQDVQYLLPCHIMAGKIFAKSIIKNSDVFQFHGQQDLILAALLHPVQLFPVHFILHELRDQGFHLIQVSRFFHLIFQIYQIFLMDLHKLLKDHVLSRFLQNAAHISSHFLKNAESKAFETEHVNIQDAFVRMHLHQGFLCLHGKLLRHDHIIKYVRMFSRLPDHMLKSRIRFPRAGISDYKTKRHISLHNTGVINRNLLHKIYRTGRQSARGRISTADQEAYAMSSKTKIVVLHMKEIIYTGIFLLFLAILGILIFFMFGPGKNTPASTESAGIYTPGIYRTSVELNNNTFDVEVTVSSDRIESVGLTNLSETTAAMFPLVEPALDSLAEQICESQSLKNLEYSSDQQYTSMMLINAVDSALEKARTE